MNKFRSMYCNCPFLGVHRRVATDKSIHAFCHTHEIEKKKVSNVFECSNRGLTFTSHIAHVYLNFIEWIEWRWKEMAIIYNLLNDVVNKCCRRVSCELCESNRARAQLDVIEYRRIPIFIFILLSPLIYQKWSNKVTVLWSGVATENWPYRRGQWCY